jgi:hypothetical protein
VILRIHQSGQREQVLAGLGILRMVAPYLPFQGAASNRPMVI